MSVPLARNSLSKTGPVSVRMMVEIIIFSHASHLINSKRGFSCHLDTPCFASGPSSYLYRVTRISSRCEYMGKGAAVRAARVMGQHVSLIMFLASSKS